MMLATSTTRSTVHSSSRQNLSIQFSWLYTKSLNEFCFSMTSIIQGATVQVSLVMMLCTQFRHNMFNWGPLVLPLGLLLLVFATDMPISFRGNRLSNGFGDIATM